MCAVQFGCLPGAVVISQAAAAGQVFLYLVVTDHRTALVLDDRVVFSFITLNLKFEEYPELL